MIHCREVRIPYLKRVRVMSDNAYSRCKDPGVNLVCVCVMYVCVWALGLYPQPN